MTCLDDRALLRVQTGDGDDAERAHAVACSTCAARLAALARDLGRVGTVLRDTAPPARVPVRTMRWAPLAVAAALLLAVGLWRQARIAPGSNGELDLALLDELALAMATTDFEPVLDEPIADVRSTCTWGDPLLEVGCDTPDVTQVAWR